MVKTLWCCQRGGKPSPYGGWIALVPSSLMAQLLYSSSRSQFFRILNPKVESHAKIETGASGNKCGTGFPCPCTGLWSLVFWAADGVTSTLAMMTKRASKVSMHTGNLCWDNAVMIYENIWDYPTHRLFRSTDTTRVSVYDASCQHCDWSHMSLTQHHSSWKTFILLYFGKGAENTLDQVQNTVDNWTWPNGTTHQCSILNAWT